MSTKPNIEEEFSRRIKASQGIIHKVSRVYCESEVHRKDLEQEMLIQLWQSYPSFRGVAKFSTWMYRVVLNVALQDVRKVQRKRRFFSLSKMPAEVVEENNPPGIMEEKFAVMYRAISRLNRVEKAIVMLYLDERSNQEIADIVGITQNYVRVKMNRIKAKLKKEVNP